MQFDFEVASRSRGGLGKVEPVPATIVPQVGQQFDQGLLFRQTQAGQQFPGSLRPLGALGFGIEGGHHLAPHESDPVRRLVSRLEAGNFLAVPINRRLQIGPLFAWFILDSEVTATIAGVPVEFLAAPDLDQAHNAMIEQTDTAIVITGNQQRDFNAPGAVADAANYIAFFVPVQAGFRVSEEDARCGPAFTQPLQYLYQIKGRFLMVSGAIDDAVSDDVVNALGFGPTLHLLAWSMVILFGCDWFHGSFLEVI